MRRRINDAVRRSTSHARMPALTYGPVKWSVQFEEPVLSWLRQLQNAACDQSRILLRYIIWNAGLPTLRLLQNVVNENAVQAGLRKHVVSQTQPSIRLNPRKRTVCHPAKIDSSSLRKSQLVSSSTTMPLGFTLSEVRRAH